jgi:hypothetical protein
MPETVAGALGEIRGGTSTGVSLSTTAAYIPIPKATKSLFATPRNLSTAVVARLGLCPWALVLKTTDAGTTLTDYSAEAQDGSTSTSVTLSSIGTAAQGDFLYVGCHVPFRGATIDIDSANGTASVLTVKYWDGDSWADITATDGTDSAGASMGQDGAVTWTVPTDWAPTGLVKSGDFTVSLPGTGNKYYWTRWQFSAALDSSTTLDHLICLPQSTSYLELVANQQFETAIQWGPDGFSSIEALTDAGTANLVVGYGSRSRF